MHTSRGTEDRTIECVGVGVGVQDGRKKNILHTVKS